MSLCVCSSVRVLVSVAQVTPSSNLSMSFRQMCAEKAAAGGEGSDVRPPPQTNLGEPEATAGNSETELIFSVFPEDFVESQDDNNGNELLNEINERERLRSEARRNLPSSQLSGSSSGCGGGGGSGHTNSRCVKFGSVAVREYRRMLGGSSGIVSKGAIALGLSDEYEAHEPVSIDAYESAKTEDDFDTAAYYDVTPARERSKLLAMDCSPTLVDLYKKFESRLQKLVRDSRRITLQDDPYCVQQMCNADDVIFVGCHPEMDAQNDPHVQYALQGLGGFDRVDPVLEQGVDPEAQDRFVCAELKRIEQDIQQCIEDKAAAIMKYEQNQREVEEENARMREALAASSTANGTGIGAVDDVFPGRKRRSARAAAAAAAAAAEAAEAQRAAEVAAAAEKAEAAVAAAEKKSNSRRSSNVGSKGKSKSSSKAVRSAKGNKAPPSKSSGSNKGKKKSSPAKTSTKTKMAEGSRKSRRASDVNSRRMSYGSSSGRRSRRCSLASSVTGGEEFAKALAKYSQMGLSELAALLREKNLSRGGDLHRMAHRLAQAEVDAGTVATVDELEADTESLEQLLQSKQSRKKRRRSGRFENPTASHTPNSSSTRHSKATTKTSPAPKRNDIVSSVSEPTDRQAASRQAETGSVEDDGQDGNDDDVMLQSLVRPTQATETTGQSPQQPHNRVSSDSQRNIRDVNASVDSFRESGNFSYGAVSDDEFDVSLGDLLDAQAKTVEPQPLKAFTSFTSQVVSQTGSSPSNKDNAESEKVANTTIKSQSTAEMGATGSSASTRPTSSPLPTNVAANGHPLAKDLTSAQTAASTTSPVVQESAQTGVIGMMSPDAKSHPRSSAHGSTQLRRSRRSSMVRPQWSPTDSPSQRSPRSKRWYVHEYIMTDN